MSSHIRVICMPSSDGAFAAAVHGALAHEDVKEPADLERAVRPWAPSVVVRSRELSGESNPSWYVYRDGRFAATRDAEWHVAPGTPWASFEAVTGTVLAANSAFCALVGHDEQAVIGRPYQEFVFPEAAELAARVYAEIVRTGSAHSVVQLRRTDGSSATVEYVARTRGDTVEAWYRPIAIAGSA